ncbi:heavy-metal-associated domain-containing protein [Flavobacterium capsici]|uniref:Heavy metal-associated domain-containing protein n=1 Tax=Flavobacterium capsici TaxID=3075618 RepID=A0AA96EYW6_9FLAO|nr:MULTISPECIES: heavy metal-associated domain-containing protein [unclassified Flavobacterium]WNM19405.1 heavy metal-associated domain-containing protein [Flavobacterium sp. PMR2A8]WNM20795.1 heavy metal-associated domain-containing protein [Flavobacterium sp. PMTSA4]
MKLTSSLVTLALSSFLLISCKETGNKAEIETNTASVTESSKPNVVAKPEVATFKIDGMSCAIGCAKTIEKKLNKTEGVQEANVDFEKKEATVSFDAAVVSPEKLQEIVEKTADGKTYKVSDLKVKA